MIHFIGTLLYPVQTTQKISAIWWQELNLHLGYMVPGSSWTVYQCGILFLLHNRETALLTDANYCIHDILQNMVNHYILQIKKDRPQCTTYQNAN